MRWLKAYEEFIVVNMDVFKRVEGICYKNSYGKHYLYKRTA